MKFEQGDRFSDDINKGISMKEVALVSDINSIPKDVLGYIFSFVLNEHKDDIDGQVEAIKKLSLINSLWLTIVQDEKFWMPLLQGRDLMDQNPLLLSTLYYSFREFQLIRLKRVRDIVKNPDCFLNNGGSHTNKIHDELINMGDGHEIFNTLRDAYIELIPNNSDAKNLRMVEWFFNAMKEFADEDLNRLMQRAYLTDDEVITLNAIFAINTITLNEKCGLGVTLSSRFAGEKAYVAKREEFSNFYSPEYNLMLELTGKNITNTRILYGFDASIAAMQAKGRKKLEEKSNKLNEPYEKVEGSIKATLYRLFEDIITQLEVNAYERSKRTLFQHESLKAQFIRHDQLLYIFCNNVRLILNAFPQDRDLNVTSAICLLFALVNKAQIRVKMPSRKKHRWIQAAKLVASLGVHAILYANFGNYGQFGHKQGSSRTEKLALDVKQRVDGLMQQGVFKAEKERLTKLSLPCKNDGIIQRVNPAHQGASGKREEGASFNR